MGILKTVITQNIDNLHQEAGSSLVIEVHGNGFRMRCTSCGKTRKQDRKPLLREAIAGLSDLPEYTMATFIDLLPKCDHCAAIMRPDVVMFGESIQALPLAFEAAAKCDIMLALGTSGAVYPAAGLPFEAKEKGAGVIVVNPHENAFARISDVYIPMTTGQALPLIVTAVKDLKGIH